MKLCGNGTGTTETHPVQLTVISDAAEAEQFGLIQAPHFEGVLRFICRRCARSYVFLLNLVLTACRDLPLLEGDTKEDEFQSLCNMVKGCRFFLLDAGVKYAIQVLENTFIPSMRPAEICKLARELSHFEWLQGALRQLMLVDPMSAVNAKDREALGSEAAWQLAFAKNRLQKEIAIDATDGFFLLVTWDHTNGHSCMTHSRCAKVWRELFPIHVGPPLRDPRNPLHYEGIPDLLASRHMASVYHAAGMSPQCFEGEISLLRGREWPDQAFLRKLVERVAQSYSIPIPQA